jgi:putative ABC transport system permease protein
MQGIWQDARFGVRMLLKNPALAAIAVVTLALGIGATTAMFSAVDALLLRPLAFPSPERIVMVWERDAQGERSNTGFQTFVDWKKETRSFSRMAALSSWQPTLVLPGSAEVLDGLRVSADLFELLGVKLLHGRGFLPLEDAPGKNLEVVVGYDLWKRSLGGDPAVVGKTIALGSRTFTVVGVLPRTMPSVFSPDARKPIDLYAPLGYETTMPHACRTCRHLRVVARLSDGATLARARDELQRLSQALSLRYPAEYPSSGSAVVPLAEQVFGDVRPILYSLLGAVGFFLLIACVNVAILQLSRAMRRKREVAIRTALGAGRRRLVRQFLAESLLLSVAGGALGFLLADFGLVSLKANLSDLPLASSIALDGRVFAFTCVISLLAGAGFGILPALRATQVDTNEALKESAKGTSPGERQRLRSILVAADVALALILLTGAGLMIRSFARLLSSQTGFDASHGLAFKVSLWGFPFNGSDSARNVSRHYSDVLRRIEALPEVESAGITSQLPLSGDLDMFGIHPIDHPSANPELDPRADRYAITPGYLHAMRIPLLSGRNFTERDDAGAPLVALINPTLARTLWPGEDALGKQFTVGDPKSAPRTVVGVAGDVLHASLEAAHTPQVYLPAPQWDDSDMTVVVRTRVDPGAALRAVRREILSVDPRQPVSAGVTLREVVSFSVERRRVTMALFAAFAALALLMAAIGIFGVVSYSVALRTHEIGIRMALGAAHDDLLRLVVGEGMKPVAVGAAVGLAGAMALGRLLSGLLYRVGPADPLALSAGLVVMVGLSLLSCWLPARRATRVNPWVALRSE